MTGSGTDRPPNQPPKRRRRQRGPDLGPQPLSEAMDAVLGKMGGAPKPDAIAAVFGSWTELVGVDLADHTQPLRIERGVLMVAADHAAWATHMRTRAAVTLDRIGAMTDHPPERIEVTVRRP